MDDVGFWMGFFIAQNVVLSVSLGILFLMFVAGLFDRYNERVWVALLAMHGALNSLLGLVAMVLVSIELLQGGM